MKAQIINGQEQKPLEIMSMFKCGDTVWYMMENKTKCGKITSMFSEHTSHWVNNTYQIDNGFKVREGEVFASKQALLNSL